MTSVSDGTLDGQRLILVEDEWFLAQQFAGALKRAGAEVVGMAPTVAQAMRLIAENDRLDGAVLDLDLQGEMAYPVADELGRRGIPFLWATAHDVATIPAQYRGPESYRKPVSPTVVAEAVARILNRASAQASPEAARNRILARLPADAFRLLEPHLKPIDLPARKQVQRIGRPIEQCIFLDSGVASYTTSCRRDGSIEIGVTGSEGVLGIEAILGNSRSDWDVAIRHAGQGRCIAVTMLASIFDCNPTLRNALHAHVMAMLRQLTSTAFAAGRLRVEERVARWILMMADRLGSRRIPAAHEAIAYALGVRRSSVTVAVQDLERKGLVSARRGQIEIRDSDGLAHLVGPSYQPLR